MKTAQNVVHSTAEASTSAFKFGDGDVVELVGIILVKKKSRSPVWHFFKPTDQVSKSGVVRAKCNMCVSPKATTNTSNRC